MGLVAGGAGYMTQFVSAEQAAGCQVVFLDTIPGATAATLGNALALHFSPHWVISSVGSDPITVGKEAKGAFTDTGATSFAELPASTDTNPWNAWDRKVLLADPSFDTQFSFTSSSPLDGNMSYGIGWGVSFAEALKAAGKNFTRASFVATLLKTTFQTPALTPLKYSASNHEGLLGGYITTVSSATSTTALGNKVVYVTQSTKSSKVTVTHRLSTTVPTWLH
jgi:branched-chain amino acid transport system substrate-binding protein